MNAIYLIGIRRDRRANKAASVEEDVVSRECNVLKRGDLSYKTGAAYSSARSRSHIVAVYGFLTALLSG